MTKFLPISLGALAIAAAAACLVVPTESETDMSVDPTTVPIAGDPNLWPEESYVPTAATDVTPTANNTPVTALFHRTAWQRERSHRDPMWLQLQAGQASSVAFPVRFQWTGGYVGPGGARFGWVQNDVADTGAIYWTLKIPEGAYVQGVTGYVICEPSVVASLPATMPRIISHLQPTDGSESAVLIEQVDASPDASSFNDWHSIGGAWSEIASPGTDELLIVEYRGMAGGGALNNALKLLAIRVDIGTEPT
jgi:hypothetical protein